MQVEIKFRWSLSFLPLSLVSPLLFTLGTGGDQSQGARDGGGSGEVEGATERGGETDESEPSTQ